jgi:hypothetical protein
MRACLGPQHLGINGAALYRLHEGRGTKPKTDTVSDTA